MARPSKLTPEQWQQIERRLAAGEGPSALAREFGVGKSTISGRVSAHSERVREVAIKVAEAQTALSTLPVAQQHNALNLADKLRSISTSLASAAELGAKTAHRLSALANSEVAKVDDAKPLESVESLRGVSALTKLANDSASIALNLLAANKEAVQRMGAPAESDPASMAPVLNVTVTQH